MLPCKLSPTSNVRRSCFMKMNEPLVKTLALSTCNKKNQIHTSSNEEDQKYGERTVAINSDGLSKMAENIVTSIENNGESNQKDFVEWDEEGYHYSGDAYKRSMMNDDRIFLMKMERVALYILALDAMNFCFWPAHENIDSKNAKTDSNHQAALEYVHLATALKKVAEIDDIIACDPTISDSVDVQSESSYNLSPEALSKMTPSKLNNLLSKYLPSQLPNLEERCRLLNELGLGLQYYHSSSALKLLQKADKSAESLVNLLLSSFSGFRDEAIDHTGKIIYFYKRAQIAVADLKAALGTYHASPLDEKQGRLYCEFADFKDMDKLTTFADYRVPQFLRHHGVLIYAPELGKDKIDKKIELSAGSKDEIYIRAATVVAVDMLVDQVKLILENRFLAQPNANTERQKNSVNAVKIDWLLWQLGEKLEIQGEMRFHHRVRTIYY